VIWTFGLLVNIQLLYEGRALLRSYQSITPGLRLVFVFCNKDSFYGEELSAPCPTPKQEDHLLLTVRDYLFNIFAVTLHTGGSSSIRNMRTRYVVVKGPTYHGKIKIYGTLNMPVVLHGYKSWSLILREVYRLSIFESRVLRKVYGPRWKEVTEAWEDIIMDSLMKFTPHKIQLFSSNQREWDWWQVPRAGEKSNRQTTLISNTEISSNLAVIIFFWIFSMFPGHWNFRKRSFS
jgi:hypothetical protein